MPKSIMDVTVKIPHTLEERLEFGEMLRMPAGWEEFLDALEKSEYRMEYDGEQMISFMGYGTLEHETIIGNIIHLLGELFSGAPYRVSGSNLALHIPRSPRRYYNADCTVIKGEPERVVLRGAMTAVANPILLVEVLSASTRNFDLGHKFFQYKNIPALRQILYIDSEEMRLFSYTRQDDSRDWLLREFSKPADAISILDEGQLALEEIYRQVDFSKSSEGSQKED